MKKNYLVLVLLLIFILFIIMRPAASMAAAGNGLLLWYKQILPSLLPLAILSNLMVYSNYMQLATKYLHPVAKHIVPTSENGCFAFLGGMLFGFPMGSKIAADLVRQGKISVQEGEILAICFNQLSPVFVSGYLLSSILNMPEMTIASYLCLYAPPTLYAALKLKHTRHDLAQNSLPNHKKNSASNARLDFGIIDAGIMNGFEALTKLGGYIVLFSIFAALLQAFNTKYPLLNLLGTGFVEVTTGISYLKNSGLPPACMYALALFFASFGGLCGFAQTCSMTSGCPFSKTRYLACRLRFAVISCILGYLSFGAVRFMRTSWPLSISLFSVLSGRNCGLLFLCPLSLPFLF